MKDKKTLLNASVAEFGDYKNEPKVETKPKTRYPAQNPYEAEADRAIEASEQFGLEILLDGTLIIGPAVRCAHALTSCLMDRSGYRQTLEALDPSDLTEWKVNITHLIEGEKQDSPDPTKLPLMILRTEPIDQVTNIVDDDIIKELTTVFSVIIQRIMEDYSDK